MKYPVKFLSHGGVVTESILMNLGELQELREHRSRNRHWVPTPRQRSDGREGPGAIGSSRQLGTVHRNACDEGSQTYSSLVKFQLDSLGIDSRIPWRVAYTWFGALKASPRCLQPREVLVNTSAFCRKASGANKESH